MRGPDRRAAPAAPRFVSGAKGGALLIIGGGEDRQDDKAILARFADLAGGSGSKIVVLTAASTVPERVWSQYDAAFDDLGIADRLPLHIDNRAAAGDPAITALLDSADGIFISGGDQKRLLALTGGTPVQAALHAALRRGACIAGTSAGASAMSAHMLAHGRAELVPVKGAIGLGAGYGFVQRMVIDQHFSERQRLARLLSVVAQNPYLLGVGIDEDTALQIESHGAIEVVGSGTVTIIDGRQVVSNVSDIAPRACPELIDVRLHLLPSGSRYAVGDSAPAAIAEFVALITEIA